MSRVVELPYGSEVMTFAPPAGWRVVQVAPTPPPGSAPLEEAVGAALAAPVAGPRLRDLARPGMTVAVAVTDATRPCPDHRLLPALMSELEAAGVRCEDVTAVVALGMHRHCTGEERTRKLGPLGGSLRVEEAQGAETADYRDLGRLDSADAGGGLPAPVPMHIHRRIVDSDLVISTGVVEPHQYAGFSGGRKTVGIGCAAGETIRVLHGIDYLDHPGTRLGRLEGNPVHRAVSELARRAGLAFVLNVAHDAEGRLVGVAAGEPGAVLQDLVGRLAPHTWAPVGEELFDAVLVGVGAPKDANLYQASRALTYPALSPRPVVKPGGWLALAARCEEGAGRGPGEREFLAHMRAGSSPDMVVENLRSQGFGAGGQRALVLSRALARFRGLVVGAACPDDVEDCHLASASDAEEAMSRLAADLPPDARVLVVPHGLATLPTPDVAS